MSKRMNPILSRNNNTIKQETSEISGKKNFKSFKKEKSAS